MRLSFFRDRSHLLKTLDGQRVRNQRQRIEIALAWVIGLFSLTVYFLTLSPGVYPGGSARAVATVLDLLPLAPIDHPVWRMVAQSVADIPVLSLPVRLNFFSAVCGALTVAIFFRLTSRVLFEFIHTDPLSFSRPYSAENESDLKEEGDDDRRDYVSAMVGGALTAVAFAFGTPFWSASVSLHPQTFDLLVFALMVTSLASYVYTGSIISCVFTVFLLNLGLLESVLFVVTAPVVIYLLFRAGSDFEQISESFTLLFFVSATLGLGVGVVALANIASAHGAVDLPRIVTLLTGVGRSHLSSLTEGLPHMGWLLVLLETLLPLAVIFWGAPQFFTSSDPLTRWLWGLLNILFTLVSVACLLGISHTPWGLARHTSYIPVIPGLATALTIGILYAYWHMVRNIPQLSYQNDDYYTLPPRSQKLLSLFMTLFIVAVVLAAPFRNFSEADGRKGAFADVFARETLAQTGKACCLVSDGVLDMHLLIQSNMERRKLTVAPVAPDDDNDSPSLSSTTKKTAPVRKKSVKLFIEQWLRLNPQSCGQVAVVASPALWQRAGFCAVPNGLVYMGTANAREIDVQQLLKRHEALWQTLTPLFAQNVSKPPPLATLMTDLRCHASRMANDLGIFLESRNCNVEANRAYEQALRLDSKNLCAAFNRYGLWLRVPSFGAPSEQERQIQLVSQRLEKGFLFEEHVPLYGMLRQQPATLLEGHCASATNKLVMQWMAYSQSASATVLRPYSDLTSDKGNTLARVVQALRAGDKAAAENRLRTFLNANPGSLSGWSILADLLLNSGKFDELSTTVLPAMRKAAGEKGHELVDMTEGLLALHQTPPRHRDARTFFIQALTRHPGLKEAQDQLLLTDLQLNDILCIETDAKSILKFDTKHCMANALLGSVFLSQKRYDEAEKHLRQSVATLPNASALNDLAELLRAKKNLAEAEKSARQALKINPNFYQAWDTLGNTLADQNRLSEAETALRCAVALCSTDPRLYINLTRLNLKLKRPDEARQLLARIAPMVTKAPLSITKDFTALSKELDTLASASSR
jgi:tetratricopeptide (TPR) repeat protein